MFETFDHTADIGLRVAAPTLPELFREAALGLTSLLVENPSDVRRDESLVIELTGSQIDYLLFDWLNELLFAFESRGFLVADASLEIRADGLRADVTGESVDRARHRLAHEVKAITYHGLTVSQDETGWCAELILDI